MVIANLIGGLGNQMFQFAAGRAISLDRGSSLLLDISGFANYELHQGFELQRIFDCNVGISDKEDTRDVLGWQSSSLIRRVISRHSMAVFRRREFVVEPHFHYWQKIKNVPSNCYLLGYWQSEKYFLGVASQIRKDFCFRLPLEKENSELANNISQVNSVSLHVRRGDYAHNPKTAATYGICSLDYYKASIKYIAKRVQKPYFFVFSDDIAWAKNSLQIEFPHQYVDQNHGEESYNDMRLMSFCQHHILANSSFSWWGAWLNPNPEKIVVAPSRWFANETNIQDLFPRGWVKL